MPVWKRSVDIFFCALAFPFLVVLTLFASVMMRLFSPGPIFFLQERVGLDGRRFKIYKFRTMHVQADTKGHQEHFTQLRETNSPMLKLDSKRDARLITGCWLMRSTGLDELPQIVNIWQGDMSIVGPRPCISYEFEQYTDKQRERCKSVPGLTGLWQVSGKNRTTFAEMIRLDCEYGDRKTLGLDIKIILLTIPALFLQLFDVIKNRAAAKRQAGTSSGESNPPYVALESVNLGRNN